MKTFFLSHVIYSIFTSTLSLALVITLSFPALLMADTDDGCGNAFDRDCDGHEAWGAGGFYDPYDQDLDDNDPSVGGPCSITPTC